MERYCQERCGILFHLGAQLAFLLQRLNDICSISQLLGCDVWREMSTFRCAHMRICVCRLRVCVCSHVSRITAFYICNVFASSQWLQCISGLLILPSLQPSCCLHVTMETLVAIHEPIIMEKEMLKSWMQLCVSACSSLMGFSCTNRSFTMEMGKETTTQCSFH